MIRQKLQSLAQQVDADSGTLVYNPTGFDRRGEVMIGGQMTEPETVIPAFGWKVLPVIPTSCQVTLTGLTAENPHYVLTLSRFTINKTIGQPFYLGLQKLIIGLYRLRI